MPRTYVAYCVTEDYMPKAWKHLVSAANLARMGTRPVVITHGFEATKGTRAGLPHCDFVPMPPHPFACSGMVQHGGWLDRMPFLDDGDLLLLSDADIIAQRDFTDAEWGRLQALDGDSFAASWNAFDGDTLEDEAARIGLASMDHYDGAEVCRQIRCVNCGVLAMRVSTWRRLREVYEAGFRAFDRLSSHRSRVQWFACHCLDAMGLRAEIMPRSFHAHGHFGVPPGVEFRPEAIDRETPTTAYYRGEKVLFRHAM